MEQNLSATIRNFSTLARDGKTLPAPVSMVIPILRRLRGHEIRLLLVYHNPRVRQSERSSLIDSLALFSEEERTNQSSR